MSSDSDSDTDSETSPPVALHLGDIVLAKSEWKALASVGRLRVGPIRSLCRPFFPLLHCPLSFVHASNTLLFASLDPSTPEPEG